MGPDGPVDVNVYTARKAVCNVGVKNTLQTGQNRIGKKLGGRGGDETS